MKPTKKLLISVGLLGTLSAAVLFLSIHSSSNASNAQNKVAPVAVEVTPVASSTLTETVAAVGTVSAMHDVFVSAETGGRITKVIAKVGDFVRQGQVLVQLDDELKAIALDQAKVQLVAAETNLSKTQKDLERAEKLRSAGDISDTELEAYRLAFRSADAQYKAAQVGLRAAQRQFGDTRIKTPVSGYVASRRVELGEMVKSGDQIANVVDLATVKIKLSIPEEEISKLRVKQAASLRLDAAPEKTFHGEVYSIGSKTETPMGHTYPVEVVVANKDVNLMKAGMFARVEIRASQVAGAITISKESLVNEDTEPGVFVAENNVAKLHPVKLGIRSGDNVQVVAGLKAGDLVISFGQKKLKDGVPVQFRH